MSFNCCNIPVTLILMKQINSILSSASAIDPYRAVVACCLLSPSEPSCSNNSGSQSTINPEAKFRFKDAEFLETLSGFRSRAVRPRAVSPIAVCFNTMP